MQRAGDVWGRYDNSERLLVVIARQLGMMLQGVKPGITSI